MSIGSKLYRTHTCENSMIWAKQHLDEAPDGAIFLADVLTNAYGRQDRTWSVQQGQLLVTFLLKPNNLATINHDDLSIRLNQLTMALSLGIVEPLKQYGAGLKWPNDFVIKNKKLGGILVAVVWEGQIAKGVIIGFALNINNLFDAQDPLAQSAISLKEATGEEQSLRTIYTSILASLNTWYDHWKREQFMLIYKSWKEQQVILGTHIQVHQKDGTLRSGIAKQVLPNGDLMLAGDDGKQQTISFYQIEEIR